MFNPTFSEITAPIIDLTREKMFNPILRVHQCDKAFFTLKEALLMSLLLLITNPTEPFIILMATECSLRLY